MFRNIGRGDGPFVIGPCRRSQNACCGGPGHRTDQLDPDMHRENVTLNVILHIYDALVKETRGKKSFRIWPNPGNYR